MNQNTAGTSIKAAREKARMSQADLANAVGVSQGTISRAEQNLPVKPKVLRRIIEILKPFFDESGSVNPGALSAAIGSKPIIKSHQKKKWSLASYEHSPTGYLGDLIVINDLSKEITSFLVADSAGTGPDAAVVSMTLDFAFNALGSAIHPVAFNPDLVRIAFERAYKNTKGRWAGPPSILVGIIDDVMGNLDMMNAGMPAPIAYRRKSRDKETRVGSFLTNEPVISALGSASNPTYGLSKKLTSDLGDSFLFYSDGFRDTFEQIEKGTLVDRFSEASRFLVGDAKGILLNLTEPLNDEEKRGNLPSDDMCALVISRLRQS